MMKWMMLLGVSFVLVACDERLNEFCKQIDEIGYERMLRKFSNEELQYLKTTRKRALLALRRAYDTHCTNPSN